MLTLTCTAQSSRLCRGLHSAAANACWPLGGWWLSSTSRLSGSSRSSNSLTIVLPGVEGRSPLNWSIAQGLNDGGLTGSIQVHDWTTGLWPLFPYHLRAHRRNRAQALAIAQSIVAWQDAHEGCETYLVGHSGGAALTSWVLEAMPKGRTVTAAAMLGPALPRGYRLTKALSGVREALWNFWTPLDLIFLAAGTLLCGNLDGTHAISGGFAGFKIPLNLPDEDAHLYSERLRQFCFTPKLLRHLHLGGHMSWANRLFIAEVVAPKLLDHEPAKCS
jgi:hypothetical protein